jgi:hypothetical protein
MRKFVYIIQIFLVIAAITGIGSAARPLNTVTYGGTGVTVDIPNTDNDVIGDNVRFAGFARVLDDGTWNGQGNFAGTFDSEKITAKLKVYRATFDDTIPYVCIHGLADVTYLGTKYSDVGYVMGLTQDGTYQNYYLEIYGGPDYPWINSIQWSVSGDDVITGRIIFH